MLPFWQGTAIYSASSSSHTSCLWLPFSGEGREDCEQHWVPRLQKRAAVGPDPTVHPPSRAPPLPSKHGHRGAERTAHGHLSSQWWLGMSGHVGTSPAPAKPMVLQQLCPAILRGDRKAGSSGLNLLPRLRARDAGAAKAFPSSRMWSWKPTICLERL